MIGKSGIACFSSVFHLVVNAVLLLFGLSAAYADVSSLKSSVVVVQEQYGAVKGTGFVWPENGYIVTAYHVVTGIRHVAVSVDGNAEPVPADIVKVLRSRDLALLRVRGGKALSPSLSVSIRVAKVEGGMKIRVYGRGQGINEVTAWSGITRETPVLTTLNRFLTSQARGPAARAGFPDLDKDVIACEISVRPGCSGAPAFDEDGHVCGIVSGGLESGLGSVCWLIPTEALYELKDSKPLSDLDQLAGDAVGSELAFSADIPVTGIREREFSGLRVVKLRTRTLSQLIRSNFDPLSISQMAKILASRNGGAVAPDWSQEKFDIYSVEPSDTLRGTSTALIVLPEGIIPTQDSVDCDLTASDPSFPFVWKLKRQSVSPALGWWGAREAGVFESSLDVLGWIPDPQFSNFSGVPAFGGYVVQRRGLLSWRQAQYGGQVVPILRGAAAITHTGRKNTEGGGILLSTGVVCQDWADVSARYGPPAQKKISIWILAVFASGFGNTEFATITPTTATD